MLKNITIEDLTIRPIATGYTGQTGALLWCKWIENLQIKNVEVCDSTITSSNNVALYNVINSKIDLIVRQTGAYPFVELPTTGQYGLYVGLACQHLTIHLTATGIWRHVITGGGTNTNILNAGVSRDITVSGSAEAAMSYTWDWHADAEGVVFQNCNVMAIGATPDNAVHNTGGVGSRCKNTTITGCNIRMVAGLGISVSENAHYTTITGNTVQQIRRFDNTTAGYGIRLQDNIVGTVITGNTIMDVNSVNFGILGDTGNNDTVITGNMFKACGAISMTDALNVVVSGNRFVNGANKALRMLGTSSGWVICGNCATGSAASTFTGTNVLSGNSTVI